jgi:undecaprenyl-diphosphatase
VLRDIVLGIVQGLTEFLPVSSSGHLVVATDLLDREPSLTYDLLLHLGTTIAVIGAMRHDLWAIVRGALGRGPDPRRFRRLFWLLVLATIPAGLAGLLLEDEFESLFERPGWVCVFWVAVALWMLAAERIAARRSARSDEPDRAPTVLQIGLAQAAAITPGISRSGATIATGLLVGLTRDGAARFSFLMSIPVILGAVASRVDDARAESFDITTGIALGFVASIASGWLAIRWLLRFVRTRTLAPFALYLLAAAPLTAILLALTD